MPEQRPSLRAQRRAETQRAIQVHAVRLFGERGYDATTVTDVAEAAGVSPMTVYRHFPTKEDLVLVDQHAELLAARVAATRPDQPLVRRIATALIESASTDTTAGSATGERTADERFLLARLRLMISTPALRAKHLDNSYRLQQAIVDALDRDPADPEAAFRAHAAASACLAAMHTALVRWAEDDGRTELRQLVAQALEASFGEHAIDPAEGG